MKSKKIMIGPIPYKIKYVEALGIGGDTGPVRMLNGYHQDHAQLIQVEKGLSHPFSEVVELHEILHGVLMQGGHMEMDNIEPLIDRLSYGLIDLFRQNPDYMHELVDRVS